MRSVFVAALAGAPLIANAQPMDYAEKEVSIRKAQACECAQAPEPGLITLRGLVVDAELRLSPDGLSTAPRQATVFDVKPDNAKGLSGRTRIFHFTDPTLCGISFDYGREYKLTVRETDEGELETNACLMPQLAAPANSDNAP